MSVRGEPVADDWAERWKQFHEPVLVGGRIWVRPPWAPAARRARSTWSSTPARRSAPAPTRPRKLVAGADARPRAGAARSPTSAAARACWRSPPRSSDSGRSAPWTTSRPRSTPRARTRRRTASTLDRGRARQPARAAAAGGRHGRRQPDAPAAARAGAPHRRAAARRLILSGLLDEEADEVAAAFAPLTRAAPPLRARLERAVALVVSPHAVRGSAARRSPRARPRRPKCSAPTSSSTTTPRAPLRSRRCWACRARLLRDGEGWATETFTHFGTHNSTHVDAPWHYNSTIERRAGRDDRRAAARVVLLRRRGPRHDRQGRRRGRSTCRTSRRSWSGSGTSWRQLDIVLVRTGRDAHYRRAGLHGARARRDGGGHPLAVRARACA